MERLSSRDRHRLLTFLQELYAFRPQDTLRPYLIEAIPTIISTDCSSYNEVNSRIGYAYYQGWPPDHPDIPDSHEILGRYSHQSPLIVHAERTPSVTAAKMSDFVSHRTFKTTDLFNEFYRPLQLQYNMGVRLTRQPGPLIAIGLLRARRDFTPYDVMLLDVMSPHLIQAYHNATAVSRMQSLVAAKQAALAAQRQGLVALTQEGRIRFATPTAERLLACYARGAPRNRGRLPTPVQAWAQEEIGRQASESALHRPNHPWRLEGPNGTLTIRLLRQGEQFLLLLEEHPLQCVNDRLRALGLSRREADILLWVAKGKTNPEIGQILGISRRTVQKHLERVYSRLGVENRHAAMSLVLPTNQADQ